MNNGVMVVFDEEGNLVGVHYNGKLLAFSTQTVQNREAERLKHQYANVGYNEIFDMVLKVQMTSKGEIIGSQG